MWDDIRAAEVNRISAGFDSAWNMPEEVEDRLNESGYVQRRSMSAAQTKWELASSRRKLLDAIAGCTPRALDTSLYGAAGIRSNHENQHAEWLKRWRDGRKN